MSRLENDSSLQPSAERGRRVTPPHADGVRLRDIERAMVRLRDLLEPQDSLLIYYAGHGLWQEEIGLAAWLPRDAEPGFMSSLFTSDLLHLHLAAMKARKILVVSDSCYAGRMTRGGILVPADAESSSLAAQRKTRVFLAAGNTEPVPDGGSADGANSVFASSFLAGSPTPPSDRW